MKRSNLENDWVNVDQKSLKHLVEFKLDCLALDFALFY
jgi:hypothetical protein